MSPQIPGRQAERRGLRLWSVGIVLVLVFASAILVAGLVFYTGWDLLGARELKQTVIFSGRRPVLNPAVQRR